MTTLGLIRHGTTEWNLAGRMQGQMDTPLAEVGRIQAGLLAKRLAGEGWEGIIASDLTRARETAELISQTTGAPLLGLDPRLRERSFGQLEGTTHEERVQRWGEHWRELDLGMESDESLLRRWDSFLENVEREHGGKRILLVSHGGFIAPVLARYRGGQIDDHLKNTSLSIIQREKDLWNFLLLNCTLHLDELNV